MIFSAHADMLLTPSKQAQTTEAKVGAMTTHNFSPYHLHMTTTMIMMIMSSRSSIGRAPCQVMRAMATQPGIGGSGFKSLQAAHDYYDYLQEVRV